MTREEEIKYAAENNLDVSIYTPQDGKMLKETFYLGAKWADSHPVNVWHDASEMPRMNHKKIIYQTNCCALFNVHIAFIPTCLRSCKIAPHTWNEFVKEVNMKQWAYIDDILPKVD